MDHDKDDHHDEVSILKSEIFIIKPIKNKYFKESHNLIIRT